jgi:mutator protein MutT
MAAPIDVAVGILMRENGDVLLAQRPEGKPYAGYWEFPGGKVEAGESVVDALRWALQRGSRSGRVAWQFARDYAGRGQG